MEKKEEFSNAINQLLGIETPIDFTKLSKTELETLHGALTKIKEKDEELLPLLDKPLGQILDRKVLGKPLGETSLRDFLGLKKDRQGILGLGILRRLLSGEDSAKSS